MELLDRYRQYFRLFFFSLVNYHSGAWARRALLAFFVFCFLFLFWYLVFLLLSHIVFHFDELVRFGVCALNILDFIFRSQWLPVNSNVLKIGNFCVIEKQ